MTARTILIRSRPAHRRPLGSRLRRYNDVWIALAMGGLTGLLLFALPLAAALASSVVAAFVILALVDTRVAVLALVLVRSSMDVTATVPLLSAAGSSDVNAAAMMSLLVVGLGIVHVLLNRTPVTQVPLVKPFAAFLGIALLGVAIAPDANHAAQDWIRMAGAFVLYVLVVDLVRTRSDQRWMVRVLLLSSVVPLTVGLYQWFTDSGNKDTAGFNRVYGTFAHPSPYAFYLVELLPLAIVFFLHTRSKMARVGLVAAIPLILFSVYATQTRGAWIGLAVVLIVFMATRARWSLVLVPVIAGALFFALPSVQARFNEAGDSTGSVLWRQKQWSDAIHVASPPQIVTIGAGLGAVDAKLGNLTHNEYLRVLVETGIVGLAALLFLYWKLLGLAQRAYREAATPYERDLMLAFVMVFASRAVIAIADNVIVFPVLEWYFWSLAGLIVVMSGAYQPVVAERETRAREAAARIMAS